jgi:hypothetical protein
MNNATAKALREVAGAWDGVGVEGSRKDGSDQDPERGPEDERMVAGEKVRTWLDKVFGGRAVIVVRERAGEPRHYALGRVACCETRASVLGPELSDSVGHPIAPAAAVATGVWRNDRNAWVTEQITGLTEDEAIEQLVRAFQRKIPPD